MPKKSISRVRKSKSPVRKTKTGVRKTKTGVRKTKTGVRKIKSPVSKKTYKMESRSPVEASVVQEVPAEVLANWRQNMPMSKDIRRVVAEFIDPIEIFRNEGIWEEDLVNEACLRFVRRKIYTTLGESVYADINTPIEKSMFFRALNLRDPNFPIITELTINGPMDEEKMSILESYLKTNTTLSVLRLSANNINDDQAIILSDALRTNTSLTAIDLSHNNIRNRGTVSLADALKTNTSLTTINLSYNNIGDIGANALTFSIYGNIELGLAPTNATIRNIYMINNLISFDLKQDIMYLFPKIQAIPIHNF